MASCQFITFQSIYESLMEQAREKHVKQPAPYEAIAEYKVWEEHWTRCCKELNQVWNWFVLSMIISPKIRRVYTEDVTIFRM